MTLKGAVLIRNPTFAPKIAIFKVLLPALPNILLQSVSHCSVTQDFKKGATLLFGYALIWLFR